MIEIEIFKKKTRAKIQNFRVLTQNCNLFFEILIFFLPVVGIFFKFSNGFVCTLLINTKKLFFNLKV